MDHSRPVRRALIPERLRSIHDRVAAGERISDAEALTLYRSPEVNAIGAIANIIRERKNGNRATYVVNRYINYSNVCILNCQFCAFAARKRDPHAFEMAIPEIVERVRGDLARGITEVHMVGGLHPSLPAEWYLELLSSLRSLDPELHLKCFTAIEIRHLAERIFKRSIAETLGILREAGLGSLTGGGAEIFDPGVRDRICRGKESAEEWIEVHRTWHGMGGRSTCTMLYGHIETLEQRVDHLRRLRELQDETGGFTGFVPFAFVPETTELAHIMPVSAVEELRNLAVSRIYLDNIEHITAYWISLGLPLAQVALNYGVDDLHGTIVEEKIFHMAGAKTPQEQTAATMERIIREAGRTPVQRDTYYERLAANAAISALEPLRIGCVAYLNARPLIEPYAGPVTLGHPSALAGALVRNELDVALVPVFEALRHPEFPIADDVSISAWGPVWSVFLAYQGPLDEVRRVQLDPASLTSSHLCKVIFQEWMSNVPEFVDGESELEAARLLIGNQAIEFRARHGEEFSYLDLAEEWKRRTGLPFVFAVWSMRPELVEPERVAQAFRKLAQGGMAAIPAIVSRHSEFSPEFVSRYLTHYIRFMLGDAEKQAIQRFRELLWKHGMLDRDERPLRFV